MDTLFIIMCLLIISLPILVLLFTKLIKIKKVVYFLFIPSFCILVASNYGFGIMNKYIEFFVIYFSIFIMFASLDFITPNFERKAKWLISVLYSLFSILISILIIWGLDDYLAEDKIIELEDKKYFVTMAATGNMTDFQLSFENRKKVIDDLLYQIIDSKVFKEVGYDDIENIEEHQNHIFIHSKNGRHIKLKK